MKTTPWKPLEDVSSSNSKVLNLLEDGFIHVNGALTPTKGDLASLIFLARYFTFMKGVSSLVTDKEGNEVLNIEVKKEVIQDPTGDPYAIKIFLIYGAAISSIAADIEVKTKDLFDLIYQNEAAQARTIIEKLILKTQELTENVQKLEERLASTNKNPTSQSQKTAGASSEKSKNSSKNAHKKS